MTSTDLASAERGQPPSQESLLNLAQYTLHPIQRDAEFVLLRGCPRGSDERSRPSILVRAPQADHPSPACLRRMQGEYALRSELDPAYVVRSLCLLQDHARPMLVLEDPGGTPLDQLLNGAMEVAQSLRLAIPVAAALGHVHNRGLVHEDVKPANILVNTARDQAWLMGLGIASRVARERRPAQPEFAAGTLAYMAPEQTGRMNRSIDSRSDLYSFGVTLYQMFTGSLPFTASDPMEWVHCHIARRAVPPSERCASVPAPISQIIMKLLAKTAEERYQTAAGVESDLRRCLAEWVRRGHIDLFTLAEHDTPDRLLIPEKLYGRKREVDTLLACFDRVIASGAPEFVLVRGYSGVGKSSVVNELHGALVTPRGLFASGKADQYKRDIPYSTVVQAFQSLVRPLLGKSDAELGEWRDALVEALDPNGQLMVDLVPELKLIIGEQPAVPDLPAQQARGRFQLVLRRFISVFAQPEHPVALFLDDLQWLDSATLGLLEDLLTRPEAAPSDLQHLILIGAYRDNEVEAAHPLTRKLQAIRNAGGKIEEITVAPLAREHVEQLIADALRCETRRVAPLAQLVHEKTGGNPFFTIQFISTLAEEGLIRFDHGATRWSWDLERIRAKGYTDNVVDLMVGKLTRLPPETQEAMQRLACVGNTAQIRMLAGAFGTSEEQVHADLSEAVRLELVERLKGSYKFAHDRVQEAAYSLIPEPARAPAHLRIGHLLLRLTPPEQREETIFDIVNQLNRGEVLLTEQKEREDVAELNLIAGKRAKASTAYASACTYLRTGMALLGRDGWTRRYELALALWLERAECEYLGGEFDEAERLIPELLAGAASNIDKAAVYRLKIDLHVIKSENPKAVASALECLRLFGIEIPPHPAREEVEAEYEKVWSNLEGQEIESLIDLPLMTDPQMQAAMRVLSVLFAPAGFTDINLTYLHICHMVNLTLRYGTTGASTHAYAFFGCILGPVFRRYTDGYRFGRLACDLVEKHGLLAYKAKTYFWTQLIALWTRPLQAAIDYIRTAFRAGVETGDLAIACYSCNHTVTDLLTRGDHLDEVWRESERGLDFARKARFRDVIDIIVSQQRFIENMRGRTANFSTFSDATFDEEAFEAQLNGERMATMVCWYWILKVQAQFMSGDYTSALSAARKAKELLWSSEAHIQWLDYHYYTALTIAAAYQTLPPDGQSEWREVLAAHLRQLRDWAQSCSATFRDKHFLVAAESARLDGRELDAQRLYEEAIRSAGANGFVQHESLAYELAARFYAARGFEKFARVYLKHARDGYLRWGAAGKVRQLEQLYPDLSEQERAPAAMSTIGAPVENLDLATVIKVSQAVSGEMLLERLIDTLMRTAVEHAGAEKGLLILSVSAEQRIAAEATTNGQAVIVHVRDDRVSSAVLPESVLQCVVRTMENVILDDASARNPFSADPYIIRHRPRSVLCLPLSSRGRLIGVLYLENNLAPRVFAPARITVLKLLASQAATSLENTRLFRDLAEREVKFRRLVEANIFGIVIWDFDGHILEANEAFLRMVGYEREDLVSGRLRWTDLTPPRSQERDREELVAQTKRTGSLQPLEWEFFRKNGSRVPVLIGAARFEGENQGVGFVLDLTERKRTEQALRQSEAHLAEAQRLAHTGSWAYNYTSGKLTYWSDEMFRLFGLDPRRGHPPLLDETRQIMHPEDRERAFEELAQVFRDKAEYMQDYRVVMPDGTIRYLHSLGHPVLDQAGELVEYLGTAIDVTERKRAEQRLLLQHRVTRILSEAASVDEAMPQIFQSVCECLGCDHGALWRFDREASVLRCAQLWLRPSVAAGQLEALTRTTIYRQGRGLPGRVWARRAPEYVPDIVHDLEFQRAEVAAREGLHAAFAFPILLGNEVLGVVEFISRDVWRPDKDLLDMLATIGSQIGQFIERKRAENALQLAQSELAHVTRVMTMGELTASIAHEVNQPLGAIVTSAASCARWLAGNPPNMEKALRALQRIINDGTRASEVIGRIRALMKRQAPRKYWLDINETILEVVALAQYQLRRDNILLETRLAEGLPFVEGDKVQLQQVLLNLIVNAIEAMSGINERQRELTIVSAADGPDAVRIEVRDSGRGLDAQQATHLFEPFYTTKAEGIGIGLSISRSIVEAHGGTLSAAANAPYGVVFRFSLPVQESVP